MGMKLHGTRLLALLISLAFTASVPQAFAQPVAKNAFQNRGSAPAAATNTRSTPKAYVEELPPGHMQPMPSRVYHEGFGGQAGEPEGFYPHDFDGGDYCASGECGSGACSGTGNGSCGGGGYSTGQFFFTGDYLYVRASFSEAQAFLEQDLGQTSVDREFHQLDFDYASSYRFGGGYRLCGCGEEIRFLYTRLRSPAEEVVPGSADILIPLEPGTPNNGTTLIDAEVDVKSYDLEFAKSIPLGGDCCGCSDACGCGDACGGGCGECCAPSCPTWDVTWSGGFRVADADWHRRYTALDANDVQVGDAISTMDFEGVGAKVGIEGRRYFFPSGWFSAYLKGDISLLVGDVEIDTVRTIEGGTAPDFVTTQFTEARNIIPVTEIEAGISSQITCNSRLTAGYLLSAWHDLGFRDEFALGQDEFPLRYDDANILGFDGFFARAELSY